MPCLESVISQWAILAIPAGQTIATDSLVVVTSYARSRVSGTALSVNATSGLITVNTIGIYDIHSWAEFTAAPGGWNVIEGPVFQGGQDYQDIGNGLMWHNAPAGFTIDATVMQHKTTFVVASLPQSVNLQVAHTRGSNDFVYNGGLTIVKIGTYT